MKLDSNGYSKSLFDTSSEECYLCGRGGDICRHEICHGANRQLSKYYGLWINLCPECHAKVHREDNGKYRYLKQDAEDLFTEAYPDKNFMEIFGRSWK